MKLSFTFRTGRYRLLNIFLGICLATLYYEPQAQPHGHGHHENRIIPSAPTICHGQRIKLVAQSKKHPVKWYTQPTGGSPIAHGRIFLTPPLTTTTTYYAQTGNHLPRIAVTVSVASGSGMVWNELYGGSGRDQLYTIGLSHSGGPLLCGSFGSTNYLAETDNNGAILWQKALPSSSLIVYSIVKFPGGGYLLGGLTQTDSTMLDYHVMKVNNTGDLEWEARYGGSGLDDLITIIPASNGGFILAGITESVDGDVTTPSKGMNDFWIIRIDNTGNILWDKTYGGSSYDVLRAAIKTYDGGYLFGGGTWSSDGDITDGNNGDEDVWIVKTDVHGNKLWDKTFGGSSGESAADLLQVHNGFLIVGATRSSDGDITDGNNGNSDGLIIKTSFSGTKLWDKTYGSSQSDQFSFIRPYKNSYLISGYTWGNDQDVTDGNNGLSDAWVLGITSSGAKLFDKTYGSSEAESPIYSLLTADGSLYIGSSTLGSDGDVTAPHNGNLDWWLLKLHYPCIYSANTRYSMEDENLTFITNDMSAYPNPFSHSVTFRSQEKESGITAITIYSVSGKEISTHRAGSVNIPELTIDTSTLENGVYFFKVQSGNNVDTYKLIRQD